jgi:cell division protease FtsH
MSQDKKPPAGNGKDQKPPVHRQHQMRFGLAYIITGLIVLYIFQQFVLTPMSTPATQLTYSEFKGRLRQGLITKVVIGSNDIQGEMKNTDAAGKVPVLEFDTPAVPGSDPKLIEELEQAGVTFGFQRPPSPVGSFLVSYVLPLGILAVIYYSAYRRIASSGGLGAGLSVGKSKATSVKAEEVNVSFKDVGGADEAIQELQEIIEFLKEPEHFARLGGRIPKGVLLVGPPGTGKTLLAKATAGEAHVSFFESSGSEFVEMFVGVGAARVRDLFQQARQAAPAIVFIDEIDAIGQSRGGVMRLGGNDEREQTLNQLLAEIDGFRSDLGKPVIIMAATNRPEVLDQALLRAGRFDRQVAVGNPDLAGRLQILKIHSRGIKLAPEFDLDRAARMTPGFSGADLANAINEAALLAARRGADAVALTDLEAAIERLVAGLETKSRIMNEQERTAVSYHESGHALVAGLVPHGDPVAKISIVPRGRGALGYTLQMPTEDRYLQTVDELRDRVAVMLGGRAGELTALGSISTGASDDIMRATELARRMVTEFGMSEKLGSVRYAGQQLQYLQGMVREETDLSPRTREVIDAEVQCIVTEGYERAQGLLKEHRPALESLARQLLQQETLTGEAVKQALEGKLGTATPQP